MDVNGSVRGYIQTLEPASYWGTDMREGNGVDQVIKAADLPALGSFDIVVSTEMLEHAEDWRATLAGMIGALNNGGLLIITTRSKGFPYHDYPGDHWRYSRGNMHSIIAGSGLEILCLEDDPQDPGIFLKASKPEDWVDPVDNGWDNIELETP